MPAQLIDGKKVAGEIREELKKEVEALRAEKGIVPGLAVIIVGEDPASRVYVNAKKKACAELGFYSEEHTMPVDTKQEVLINLIKKLNADPKIHGILCQLPIPKHLNEEEVLDTISPTKDVDGFHPVNVGNLYIGKKTYLPCTPAGCIELIKRTGVEIKGKEAVVVGRSNIVGKPVAMLLLSNHATVTICHSRTQDLPGVCRRGDILVVAIGKPEFVKGSWIKPGAVVIDVGVNRGADKKLLGDVAFNEVLEVAGFITPVPGGVGPMTITMLMRNTLEAARRSK